jgi:hypothetical protein
MRGSRTHAQRGTAWASRRIDRHGSEAAQRCEPNAWHTLGKRWDGLQNGCSALIEFLVEGGFDLPCTSAVRRRRAPVQP